MSDDFTAFAVCLNRVHPGTFSSLASRRPHEVLGAAMQIRFAATTPHQDVADSIKDYLDLGHLLNSLENPDWRASAAAYAAIVDIARRFGPDFSLDSDEIERNPLKVCAMIEEERNFAIRELRAILYPDGDVTPARISTPATA